MEKMDEMATSAQEEIEKIEKMCGINQKGKSSGERKHYQDRNTKKEGIQERKEKKSGEKGSNERYISERKELQGNEKIRNIEKKNKLNGKKGKREKEKEKNNDKRKKLIANEMKNAAINQLIGDEEENEAFSGIIDMRKNLLWSKGEDVASVVAEKVGEWSKKIFLQIIEWIFKLYKWLIASLVSIVCDIIATIWPVLLVALVICLCVVAVIETSLRIVYYIDEHVETVEKEIDASDEVYYHVDGPYYADKVDASINKDDMLLIFLSKAVVEEGHDTATEDVSEGLESAPNIEGTPQYEIDKSKETQIRDEVLGRMLYFKKGSYEKEITVTVAPKPTVTPEPAEIPEVTPGLSEEDGEMPEMPVVSPEPLPEQLPEEVIPTMTPIPEPTPTPIPETETITITVDTIDVYLCTAPDYIKEYRYEFTEEQLELYGQLLSSFKIEGYLPGNGSIICDTYGKSDDMQ